ncbi:acyl-CoA dehydrogenase [Streptodolium elevatio]|uniref:Acyl-CoA dehydrogenase family protein n=1 Tax=Streptodolium elevatio TaxID=3157996 RepID=A0ABV3DAZ8_9ACTN
MIPATPAPAHRPLDLGLAPGAEEFRAEVCAWLTPAMALGRIAAHRDPDDRTGLGEEFERALLREAGKRGWLGISVPSGAGGGGRPASWAAAFAYEVAWHHAPLVDTGVVLASAPVAAYGSAGQRGRLLPGMLDGRETWCCAYTELAAGNDLFAGLRAEARQDGDGTWRITGTKALVTGAAKADRCLTVARTPGGTAMFVVALRSAVATDPAAPRTGGVMAADGVEIRRIPTIAGYTLDEIVFDGAEAELLGDEGAGRRQVARAVRAEHGGLFQLGWAHRLVSDLTACLAGVGANCVDGRRDGSEVDPVLAEQLGGLWVHLLAGRGTALAPVFAMELARPDLVAAMLAKIRLTELVRDAAREAASAVRRFAATRPPGRARSELESWETRFAAEAVMRLDGPISVGANDLHREAVASFVLGERPFDGGKAAFDEAVAEPLSAAWRALRTAVDRVNSRTAYGTTVSRLPVVRRRLADMYGELDAAWRLAAQADEHGAAEEVVLAAADHVGRACRGVVEEAVELCGGHGYLADSGLGALLSTVYGAERLADTRPSPRARIAVRVLAAEQDAARVAGGGVPAEVEGSGR